MPTAKAKGRGARTEREHVVREFFRGIESGDPEATRTLFSEDCKQHNPFVGPGIDVLLSSMADAQRSMGGGPIGSGVGEMPAPGPGASGTTEPETLEEEGGDEGGAERAPSGTTDFGLDIQHVLVDGDMVAVYATVGSRATNKLGGMRQVHLFRFAGDKIAEYWDVTQPLPDQSPNSDGVV